MADAPGDVLQGATPGALGKVAQTYLALVHDYHASPRLQIDLKKLGALGIDPLGGGLNLQVCRSPATHASLHKQHPQAMAAEGGVSESDDDGAIGKADDAQDYSDVELSEGDMDDDDDDDDGMYTYTTRCSITV